MKSFADLDKENNGNYIKLLSATAKLSRLFSESQVYCALKVDFSDNKLSIFIADFLKPI